MKGKLVILRPHQFERYRSRISDQLGAKDRERVDALLQLIDPENGAANLAKCYDTIFPGLGTEAAAAALRKFRLNFNGAAKEAGCPDVRLSGDTKKKSPNEQRSCWIEGPDTLVAEIEEISRAGAANTEDHEPLPSRVIPKDDRLLVRFFVSFSHQNNPDKEKLLALLREELDASGKYRFELWFDGQIILGEKWHEHIQTALKSCDLGLLLASPTFLSSKYIADHELPAFVSGEKPCIPVELKPIDFKNHNTRGLEERQIFRSRHGKAFTQLRTKQHREEFARELARRIYDRLAAHPPSPRSPRPALATRPPKPQLHEIAEFSAVDSDCPGAFIPTRARAWGILHKEAADTRSNGNSEDHDAIQFLSDWALKPGEAPFFALLGEYGMGKTTTLKQFTRRLLDEREKDPNLPLPIYIDLRHRMSSSNGVPRLEEILDNALRRNWRKTEPLTVTAQQLIGLARQGKAIVLFDGLDEQIVHYSEADAQIFIRELWSITPPALIGGPNPPSTKVLISCRSHYFKDLRQQDNMLTGEQREGLKPSHYKVAFILPFTMEQIRSYLNQELGEEAGRSAWELLSEIHDLRDLASRPYLLSLITGHIEEIERLKASGRPIRPVTLYQILTRSWLDRDAGKHHLDPDHKPRIMSALAAAMHRDGAREWPWTKLVTWFDRFFHDHPELANAYRNKDRALLLEDLRTATFILRPDTEEQNFRFAHSSLLEYFLSTYLHEALLENQCERWDMPAPSRETLRFVGEWMEILDARDATLASMASLLEQDRRPRATLNAFRYVLLAADERLPLPRPERYSLAGQNLSGLQIRGRKDRSPLALTRADFSGANLRRTRWENVNLSGALFTDAELQQSDFSDCLLTDADFSRAELTEVDFTDCVTHGVKSNGARQLSTFFHRGLGYEFGRPTRRPSRISKIRLAIELPVNPTSVAFSPDGRTIVSGSHDGTLRLWDATTTRCLLTFEGHMGPVTTAAFSPDGRTILSSSHDRTLRLWDAATAKCLLTFEGHTDWVTTVAFSPDGRTILSGSHDRTLRLWDAATARCLLTFEGHTDWVTTAAFSPDGQTIVSGSDDGTLRLWDAATARCLLTCEGHVGQVTTAAFSPDGRTIVSGSSNGTLRLWGAAIVRCLLTFKGHTGRVNSVAFSPDGRTILSSSYDGTLRLWDATTAKCLLTCEGHTSWVTTAAFSPDGRTIVSGSAAGTLRLWSAASGAEIHTVTGHRRDENACIVLRENRIVWAEKDAWRHIQWMLPPNEGEIYPTPVPGDYFEDFPIGLES